MVHFCLYGHSHIITKTNWTLFIRFHHRWRCRSFSLIVRTGGITIQWNDIFYFFRKYYLSKFVIFYFFENRFYLFCFILFAFDRSQHWLLWPHNIEKDYLPKYSLYEYAKPKEHNIRIIISVEWVEPHLINVFLISLLVLVIVFIWNNRSDNYIHCRICDKYIVPLDDKW